MVVDSWQIVISVVANRGEGDSPRSVLECAFVRSKYSNGAVIYYYKEPCVGGSKQKTVL